MKHISSFFLSAIIFICFTSCFTDSTNYYIKYEAKITDGGYTGANVNYIVSTEKGPTTIATHSMTWTETFGPVKKGFEASIYGEAECAGKMTLNIYVCRGEEPFVLKASQTGEMSYYGWYEGEQEPMNASVSYTIDF